MRSLPSEASPRVHLSAAAFALTTFVLGVGMTPRASAALAGTAALAVPVVVLAFRWHQVEGVLEAALRPLTQGRLRDSVEWRLVSLLRPHTRTVLVGLGLTLASTAVGVAKPWPTKILVDDVFGDGRFAGLGQRDALTVAAIMTVVLFLLSGGLALAQTRLLYGLTQRLIRDLRTDVFRHLTRASLRYHDSSGVGDTAYRISADTYALHTIVLGGLVPLTAATLTLVGTGFVMFSLDPVLAPLAMLSVPAAAIVSRRFAGTLRSSSVDVHERESQVYSHAEQTFTGIRTVQAFGRERFEADRFLDHADRSRGAMVRLVTEQTVFGLAVDGVLGLGIALVTWIAANRALAGHLSVGEVLVFLAYAATLYTPVSQLAGVVGELQTAAAGAQRVFEVLDAPQPHERPGATAPAAPARGELRLDGVSFGYAPGSEVLRDVGLTVTAGSTVALVGPTGAGKSTVLSLLLRLYDPDEGSVQLDGIDLRDLSLGWLRDQVAFVPQEPVLFPETIRENIRYGRLDASDDEVEEAARLANLYDEFARQPAGLDTPVGDRGVMLSGGQRQRIALARAFLKDAPVLLLDEPTAALDAETEVLVMDALWRLRAGRTCLVIAHRLSTVRHADAVVVVEEGRIVQQGDHPTLIRQPGLYRRLHEARFGRERGRGVVAIESFANPRTTT